MPTTRRKSAAPARNKPTTTKPSQTKLAFHGQISKGTSSTSSKDAVTAVDKAETLESTITVPTVPAPSVAIVPTTDEVEVEVEVEDEEDDDTLVDTDIFPPGLASLELDEEETEEWRTAVQKARAITDAQVQHYWTAKEQARTTPRVHQNDMTLAEKVLADWDIDSRYGVSLLSLPIPPFFFRLYLQ
jgi:DNA polymerase delta subunit 4